MFNAILLILQFIMNYILLFMYMSFITPLILLVTPSSWWEGLRQSSAVNADYMIFLALLLIVPALLSRFSLFQSILLASQGAHKAVGDELSYIEQIVTPVLKKAGIPRNGISLYIQNGDILNAYAFGDRHIIVTRQLLSTLPPEEIGGIIAHEMGHLTHHHTQWLLLRYGMNLPLTIVNNIYRLIIVFLNIFRIIPILGFLIMITVFVFDLWLRIVYTSMDLPFRLVTLFKARKEEYEADHYAYTIGYGVELHNALLALLQMSPGEQTGFFSRIWSDHPMTQKRLDRLRELVTADTP